MGCLESLTPDRHGAPSQKGELVVLRGAVDNHFTDGEVVEIYDYKPQERSPSAVSVLRRCVRVSSLTHTGSLRNGLCPTQTPCTAFRSDSPNPATNVSPPMTSVTRHPCTLSLPPLAMGVRLSTQRTTLAPPCVLSPFCRQARLTMTHDHCSRSIRWSS